MEVEAANQAIRDGSFAETLDRLLQELQPEAVYFTAQDGKRTGLIVFDLKEPSDIPSVAEPLFMGAKASVDFSPVMTADDVRVGLEKAAKAF
jgi:hypothetical protein